MSNKKIVGIILVILGLIGAYYYIGGYFQLKSQFGNAFGMADETLNNYWPMMAASIAVLILGVYLIFKVDDQVSSSNDINSMSNKTSSVSSLIFDGEKSLSNDGYKIFLVKKYGIEKNEALGKIICEGKLFDDTEQALRHAAKLDGVSPSPSITSDVINHTEMQKVLVANKNSEIQPNLISDEAREYGITFDGEKYHYKAYRYDRLSDAISYAKLEAKKDSH